MPKKMIKSGLLVQEYILLEKVGEGGFGEVWKARHKVIEDKLAAVKIPTDPDYIEQLKKEGIIQHKLKHPGIVQTLGLDLDHSPPYFIMEFIEGESLRSILRREKRLPLSKVLKIFKELLDVLEFAHSKGIVHRDIKPENILITKDGNVKLTDFGLGRVGEVAKRSLLLSGSLVSKSGKPISGTIEYMSAEQKKGEDIDQRTDIYALGILLFELLTGELPEYGDSPSDLNNNLPKLLDRIFSNCCSRLEKRYKGINVLRKEVDKIYYEGTKVRKKDEIEELRVLSELVQPEIVREERPIFRAPFVSDSETETPIARRSWIAALLLSIFLGGWGADRFYLGYMNWGLLKLLTGGGCGVLYIIDVILIATDSLPDANGFRLKK